MAKKFTTQRDKMIKISGFDPNFSKNVFPEILVNFLELNNWDFDAGEGFCIKWAINNSQVEVLKRLIDQGADPQINDNDPIKLAASLGDAESVRVLVGAGVDVNAGKGFAINAAFEGNHEDIVDILLEAGAIEPTNIEFQKKKAKKEVDDEHDDWPQFSALHMGKSSFPGDEE